MNSDLGSPRSILITCPLRFTPWLRIELEQLGYAIEQELKTGIFIRGNFQDCLRLNFYLRTAHRVCLHIGDADGFDAPSLQRAARELPWEAWIPSRGYFSVSAVVENHPSVNHTLFASRVLKDAVVDRIRDIHGHRPDAGGEFHGAALFLHWNDQRASLYIDTTGKPLSNRGYRLMPHKAPLRETLAAAIVMATGYTGETPLVNPMCGSGTLAVEAAMIAAGIFPGHIRKNYAFQHLIPYQPNDWEKILSHCPQPLAKIPPIIASDWDKKAVEAAQTNAGKALCSHHIQFEHASFEKTTLPSLKLVRVCCVFRRSRKTQTPLQRCGTRLRTVFAVGKQHTKQVTPVEAPPLFQRCERRTYRFCQEKKTFSTRL